VRGFNSSGCGVPVLEPFGVFSTLYYPFSYLRSIISLKLNVKQFAIYLLLFSIHYLLSNNRTFQFFGGKGNSEWAMSAKAHMVKSEVHQL
jgi:hypothetical protein